MRYISALFFLTNLMACDADKDGILADEDCNDEDGNMPENDADCDGVSTIDDCNDNDASIFTGASEVPGDGKASSRPKPSRNCSRRTRMTSACSRARASSTSSSAHACAATRAASCPASCRVERSDRRAIG